MPGGASSPSGALPESGSRGVATMRPRIVSSETASNPYSMILNIASPLRSHQHRSEQRCPRHQIFQQQGLMPGVRAFPDSSHSVQCWYAQRGRKVSVRSSSGRSFLQCETHSPSESCCTPEKSYGCRSAFHRRTIQTALHFQDAMTVPNAQSAELALDPGRVDASRNADIHFGPCFRRYYIRPRSALNGADIHGDSTLQLSEPLDDIDLM